MVFYGFGVVFKLEIQNDLAEENPRAVGRGYHVRMLTEPTDTRTHRPGLFQNRRRVDTKLAVGSRMFCLDPFEQFTKSLAKHIVVIITPGIARDLSDGRGILVLVRSVIVHCQNDHRSCIGKDQFRFDPLFRLPLQLCHLPVKAILQPSKKKAAFRFQLARRDNPCLAKAKFSGLFFDPKRKRHTCIIMTPEILCAKKGGRTGGTLSGRKGEKLVQMRSSVSTQTETASGRMKLSASCNNDYHFVRPMH